MLRQKRKSNNVLFVDASKGFAKEGKNNKLRACDIKKITDVVTARATIPGFSRLVPKTELQDEQRLQPQHPPVRRLLPPARNLGSLRLDVRWHPAERTGCAGRLLEGLP
ncbi:MAG: N-6 DNA methylase [Aquabacterium sp.]